MSLINDALRRAKEAQEDAPPPIDDGLKLRPVESENFVRHGVGLVLPIALALVALLILFLVWQYAPRTRAAKQDDPEATTTEVRARTLAAQNTLPETPAAAESTPPNVVQSAPAKVQVSSAVAADSASSEQAAVQSPTPKVQSPGATLASGSSQPKEAASTAAQAGASSAAVPTNSLAATNSAPTTPPIPKLQGIVFNPRRPSAVINGRTLFVGERIAGFRLVAIGQDSATLVGGGHTNVLTLEQ